MVRGQPVPPQRGTYTAVGKREFEITSDAHGMTPTSTSQSSSERLVLLGIAVVIALWALATTAGWTLPELEHGDHARMPHPLSIAPFVMLLGAIAVLPLIPRTEHWWERNWNRFRVAAGLAAVTLAYFFFQDGAAATGQVLRHALLDEYTPFIVLLFSLYTISGGIRIEGDLPARPLTNALFIAVGGLLASFIGTTGAAMVLIRPLLETNSERKYVQHTVVFFIFVVCNCGGCLLPIGDPPLFLGYLEGVDFLWTMKALWLPWLVVNIALICVYLVWDNILYRKEKVRDIRRDETRIRPLTISGLWPNALLLVGVILAVALLDPQKMFPGTQWHPPAFAREALQLGLVILSLMWGSRTLRTENKFNYHAIVEVAVLFLGIFICMQPALQILDLKGASLGIDTPWKFFWATGSLSAVLDNAPTYLVFFSTAAAQVDGNFAEMVSGTSPAELKASEMLVGISLGAVLMGAMTYIGNGPNFMVRAIAEHSGVRMPSFFGYVIKYSLPVLVPMFLLTMWFFLRSA